MTTANVKYYFKFRQTSPRPPGAWTLCGPFANYDEAKTNYNNSKQWDCEVTPPFSATSADEAAKREPAVGSRD